MKNKTLMYIGIALFVLILVLSILATAGVFNKKQNSGANGQESSASFSPDTPEECRQPADQDVNSWKEHLGHHENTKYCLQYYK